MSQLIQAYFGVPHGRRWIPVHRAKIALTINQDETHGERLRHAHESIIHCSVTMGMVFTYHIAHDTG